MECKMCGIELYDSVDGHPLDNSNQVEDGVDLLFYGGYGMFINDDEVDYGVAIKATICHDCTIKLIEMFPEPFREEFRENIHSHQGNCGYN